MGPSAPAAPSRLNPIARVALVFEKLSLACLAIVASLIFLQIVLRNIFSLAFASLEELARMAHLNLVFLLIPQLFRENAHVNIDLLTSRLPRRAQTILAALAALATAFFAAVFLVSEYKFMLKNGTVPTPGLGLANLYFFSGAYVGMALLFLTAAERFILLFKGQAGEEVS